MTHKQQEEWAAMKKAVVGLMGQVNLLVQDLEEMATRLNEQAERIRVLEGAPAEVPA